MQLNTFCHYFNNILEDHGHNVLKLPPYHPELNLIELIWAKLKTQVEKENINEVKQMVENNFLNCQLNIEAVLQTRLKNGTTLLRKIANNVESCRHANRKAYNN